VPPFNFLTIFVVVQGVSCAALLIRGPEYEAGRYAVYRSLGEWVSGKGSPDVPVMVMDPASFNYTTGHPSLIIPSNSADVAVAVARRYGAGFLILERDHPPAWYKPGTELEANGHLELQYQVPPPGEGPAQAWRARVYRVQ
jgi:hypothetical protein